MRSLRHRRPDRSDRAADFLFPLLGVTFGFAFNHFTQIGFKLADQVAQIPLFFGAWFIGLLLPRLHQRPHRIIGLVAPATGFAALGLGLSELFSLSVEFTVFPFNLLLGLACGAALRFRDRVRIQQVRFSFAVIFGVLLALGVIRFFSKFERDETTKLVILSSAFTSLLAFLLLPQPTLEWFVERLLRWMYRVDSQGTEKSTVPATGPALIVANHASWLDPLILMQLLERPVVPMMAAGFYDLPPMRPILRRCFAVIRVEDSRLRREAPEIDEAIAALDAGHCVLIFAEGYLRRNEEQVLRRFGQGVARILAARPSTPVIPCWIEGTWGSYFSHKDGPPTKNKRFDFLREIRVVFGAPRSAPKDVSPFQLRLALMSMVWEMRQSLGFSDPPPFSTAKEEDDETAGS